MIRISTTITPKIHIIFLLPFFHCILSIIGQFISFCSLVLNIFLLFRLSHSEMKSYYQKHLLPIGSTYSIKTVWFYKSVFYIRVNMKILVSKFFQLIVHYFHIVSVFATKQYSYRIIYNKILNIIVLLYFLFRKIDTSFDIVAYKYFYFQRKCFVIEERHLSQLPLPVRFLMLL